MKGFQILDEYDTITAALNGMSIARAGDGEGAIMQGRSAKSQEYDKRLAAIMLECFTSPCDEVLACVPTFRKDGPKWQSFWHKWEPRFRTLMNPKQLYGSAFCTRPDSEPRIDTPAYWELVRSLWLGKDVMLVRGSGKSLTPERLEGAASVQEVLCPVRHAFSEYDNLCRIVRQEHAGRTVLLCCGSTATAMAYELGREHIHCVDVGHIGMFVGRREGQFNPEGNNAAS